MKIPFLLHLSNNWEVHFNKCMLCFCDCYMFQMFSTLHKHHDIKKPDLYYHYPMSDIWPWDMHNWPTWSWGHKGVIIIILEIMLLVSLHFQWLCQHDLQVCNINLSPRSLGHTCRLQFYIMLFFSYGHLGSSGLCSVNDHLPSGSEVFLSSRFT